MKDKKLIFLGATGFFVLLFAVAAFVYNNAKNDGIEALAKENMKVFVPEHSPRIGQEDAKVYITEYLDPECEACRALAPAVKNILKEFEGKVQLVIRYAPFHKNSKTAIRALEAARLQGKYAEALDMLFHYQPYWGNHHNPKPELIFDYLLQMGLDLEKLKADMNKPEIDYIINQDEQDLKTLNIRGTPTFFVNGKPLAEFGIPYLRDLVEKEVAKYY